MSFSEGDLWYRVLEGNSEVEDFSAVSAEYLNVCGYYCFKDRIANRFIIT